MTIELYPWPGGTLRPYLPVVWPHCLVATRQLRSERHPFADMHGLLEYWAGVLVQSVEMLALSQAWEERPEDIERARCEVALDMEMVRQIAVTAGYAATEADVWVTRAVMEGRELAAATLREHG